MAVIIVLQRDLADDELAKAQSMLLEHGLKTTRVETESNLLLIVLSDASHLPSHIFSQLPGAEKAVRLTAHAPIAQCKNDVSIALAGGVTVGAGARPVIMAGPCSVENASQILQIAYDVKSAGAKVLRGGAFKPRTSPYDFQGLGVTGLKHLSDARKRTGLPVVSEVMSAEQVELAAPYVDIFQIGARNMYNYELLREVGRSTLPVLLKRGLSATLHEFLNAAEYIMLEGNSQVILCERGIRTFETHTRNTLDLNGVAALKTMTGLPVVVDPSHGTGRKELIRPMARAAIACGADGLLIEVHNNPAHAMSDGEQAILPDELTVICREMNAIYDALQTCALAEQSVPLVAPSIPVSV